MEQKEYNYFVQEKWPFFSPPSPHHSPLQKNNKQMKELLKKTKSKLKLGFIYYW